MARDRDARRTPTVTVDESRAATTVRELISDDVVEAIPDEQVLRHRPSGRLFDSDRALVLFHRGWVAYEEQSAE